MTVCVYNLVLVCKWFHWQHLPAVPGTNTEQRSVTVNRDNELKTLKGLCWSDSEGGHWLVMTFVTATSILANKFWMKGSKNDQGWSGDLVWSTRTCSMYVFATLLSSAVDNLILILLCSCQLRDTVYCHRPLPWHMPSSLPLPLCLIVSSLLDADSHLTSRQASSSCKLDNQHPVSMLSISSSRKVDQDQHVRAHTHVTTAYAQRVNQRAADYNM